MEKRIAVIGTTFIDCKGFAFKQYDPLGRNLGNIKFVQGGVGRNVAENLANLRQPVQFVSTVDKSALGDEVVNRLRRANVMLDYLISAKDKGMGMWLAILDETGNLAGSISKMPDLNILEDLIAEKGRQIVEQSSHIVLEVDLNERISRKVIGLANANKKPVYGLPGNLDVILNNRDLLSDMDCFICNDVEAGRLTGEDLTMQEAKELLNTLIRYVDLNGIPAMVITMGERGCVYYDSRTGDCGHQPAIPTNIVDSSGAGDAFFSGTAAGLINNYPISKAVIFGTRVASWTIQVEENSFTDITQEMLNNDILAEIDNKKP